MMQSCTCCGAPTYEDPEPAVVDDECYCDCDDCDECEECFHDCECGDCEDCGYSDEEPIVLCHGCVPDGPSGCDPEVAWHCTCGRACDGSGCQPTGVSE